MPNRLVDSTSPYLLQHAENPVDWYPWSEEAFELARSRDVPIFLSVGYSACHWCHVMAHESFENPSVAALMNEYFVNIKVDREELPAVDSLYMEATQAMTGQGGWPNSVWLDHDRRPWYAGTYFPPRPSHGMPSFTQVLLALNDTWTNERERVSESSTRIMEHIGSRNELIVKSKSEFTRDEISFAVTSGIDSLALGFDSVNGGFGDAPKFPPSLALEFLLRCEALNKIEGSESDFRIMQMVEQTCDAMARGGIYDQLGGGFARYSVDATWTVPHFEKMLYDNAQLLSIYAHLYRLTGDTQALRITTETAEFLIREMQTPEGGFAAALDADSNDLETGHTEEGAFYAWTPKQITEVLGAADADWVIRLCNVTVDGTFELGKSVLTLHQDPDDWGRWFNLREKLLLSRETRPRPGRDDKIVASWNGLTIRALVDAGSICSRQDWIDCATRAGDLLVSTHLGADAEHSSRLVRVSRDGKPGLHALGVLEDQALVASAFLALAQVNGDDAWRELAGTLLADIKDHFQQGSGLTDTANDVEPVAKDVTSRQVDPTDNVTPSGWAATIDAALTYSALSGDTEMRSWAESFMPALIPLVASHTRFAGWGSATFVTWLDGPREVAIVGPSDSELQNVLAQGTAPGLVYAWDAEQPLLQNRKVLKETATAYVCRGFVCDAPTNDLQTLKKSIGVFN
ncbi:MAG: thioredoxin domain-containing protein [Actinobacteria bacterium]|nr:thioredoxin domain-containing protein [Actinomycetota bacterium]NBO34594.1 thioredoxin domain-containing protein [Actinomycetota bacterium]